MLACAASLTAQVTLEPRIVSETLPSGSIMQVKLQLTTPNPIITGNARFEMSSSFDSFQGVSAFSPAGDAYGVALISGGIFSANLVSPLVSLGTQLDYPFLVAALHIRAGLPNGTLVPINFSPTTIFNGPGGTPYTYVVTNGTLTIGGGISVGNVIPGGGVLPAGTTVRILGSGFSPSTQLTPGTLTISNFRYVDPTELRFEMTQSGDITGQRFRVKNPSNNNEVTYFPYLRATVIGASGRQLVNDSHPIFQRASSFTSAALPVPAAPAGGFIAVALQNSGLADTTARLQLVSAGGALLGTTSVALPAATRWSRAIDELFGSSPAGSTVRISSANSIQVLGLSGDQVQTSVTSFLAGAAPPPVASTLSVNPVSLQFSYQIGAATPGQQNVGLSSSAGAIAYSASPNSNWLTVSPSTGQTPASLSVSINPSGLAVGQYNSSISVDALGSGSALIPVTLTVTAASSGGGGGVTGLRFVPVTPCRLVDTRGPAGAFGAPALGAGVARAFALPQSPCGIPANAAAYSLNLTVVPSGLLGYLTIWPTGAAQPLVSTLNSVDGRVKANAALVPAGAGGSVSVFATGATELVLDINGYFVDPAVNPQSLAFYPLPPCRVADTRNPAGSLGGPVLAAGVGRSFPVLAANCGVPANAAAYSLNATVVPSGGPLGFLTMWPTGQGQPLVSTLNAPTGTVVANAAIVPVGTGGSVSAFASSATHLVLDINGYFAPAGAANGQRFFATTPCRLLDTRNAAGEFGGPGLAAGQSRDYRLPLTACGLPASAMAYSLNATVVPSTTLGYLTLWPSGSAQPFVSTLNALDDPIVANAAIVPAGTQGGVASFSTHATQLILDTTGYFAQ